MRDRRTEVTLAIATAVHAAVAVAIVGAARRPVPGGMDARGDEDVVTELAIEPVVEVEGARVAAVEVARGGEERRGARGEGREVKGEGARGEGREARGEGRGGVAVIEIAEGAGAAEPSHSEEPSTGAGRRLTLEETGIAGAGTNRFLTKPLVPGWTVAEERKRNVDEAIARPIREHDRSLGLGPEGPTLRELEQAIYGSTLALNGKAEIDASFGADGSLLGIEIVSCDGDLAGWKNIAQQVKARLAGQKGRAAPPRGVVSRIAVDTALKLPAGHDPGTEVSVGGVVVKKGEGKKSTKVTILDPVPKLVKVPITPGSDILIPVPQVGLTVFGTDADPSELGAIPRRVVHARVVTQRPM